MTDQEMRISIAEACGWCDPMTYPGRIPNYPNDLNAMHEAEKFLNGRVVELNTYHHQLGGIVVEGNPGIAFTPNPAGYRWHATASQRAEAFLRTLGKWRD